MKKKKSNIIYKSVGFIVLFAAVIVIIITVSNFRNTSSINEFTNDSTITSDVLGYETFNNISKGENLVSCNDAKKLSSLFMQINKELKAEDNITSDNMTTYAQSTPARQAVSKFSDDLVRIIQDTYGSKDISEAQAVLQQITQDIYVNIAQLSIMVITGSITEKEFNDFIDITYCGVKPPHSYISPHDVLINSINQSSGRGLIESVNDNFSKNINNNTSKEK